MRNFFVLVWRINGLLILLAGLLACAALMALSASLFRGSSGSSDKVAKAVVGKDQVTGAELGAFEEIPGFAVLRAPLKADHQSSTSSDYGNYANIRNYLYFDPTTRASHWLLPEMTSLVLDSDSLPPKNMGDKSANAVVHVHQIVDTDSNGDGTINGFDAKTIAITTPAGKGFRIIAKQVDRLNDARLMAPDRLLVIYSKGQQLFAAELNTANPSIGVDTYPVKIAQIARPH